MIFEQFLGDFLGDFLASGLVIDFCCGLSGQNSSNLALGLAQFLGFRLCLSGFGHFFFFGGFLGGNVSSGVLGEWVASESLVGGSGCTVVGLVLALHVPG